ncbi:MAG: glycosyltransferase family 4 protein [Acetobacteraceae bacterium]
MENHHARPRLVMVLPPREAFSPAAAGGVGLVVDRLARATNRDAAKPDAEVLVIGPAIPAPPFPGVPFLAVHPGFWPPAPRAGRYARAVGSCLGGSPLGRLAPALIEVHNRPDVALFLAARFRATPTVLFLHNDPRGMRAGRSAAERRSLLARLARVVSVSGFLRAAFLEGLRESDRAIVLPNPIELAALPPPVSVAERSPILLFAGRMVRDKGADAFVAAAASALRRLPGWRAEMFGADRSGPASPETAYLSTLRRRAAAAGITLHGYRPQAEVAAAMARASIVVVPSRWPEPFGLTALEAMAAGAALIAAPRGALPELIGDAARYVDPDDPDAFAETMVALARDLPARARLGAAGLARAREFDLPRVGEALAQLRHEILGS